MKKKFAMLMYTAVCMLSIAASGPYYPIGMGVFCIKNQ